MCIYIEKLLEKAKDAAKRIQKEEKKGVDVAKSKVEETSAKRKQVEDAEAAAAKKKQEEAEAAAAAKKKQEEEAKAKDEFERKLKEKEEARRRQAEKEANIAYENTTLEGLLGNLVGVCNEAIDKAVEAQDVLIETTKQHTNLLRTAMYDNSSVSYTTFSLILFRCGFACTKQPC